MRQIVKTLMALLLIATSFTMPTFAADPTDGAISNENTNNMSAQAESASWPMAGANPERTSWTPEEVRGDLKPVWYKSFEPYISQRVQIIAANNLLYVATSRGLYALDAATGDEEWIYPTEFPLGHSPTISDDVAYVGGLDRMLHAIDAQTGQKLWTFEAKAGFRTSPLVINNLVYLGSRDGNFYAVYKHGHPQAGQLAWKYETGGPIDYSAAYKDGVLFFASNDSYAYALDANTGGLVWKSAKLPGAGFYSWWPVVYENRVILSGSNNYRSGLGPYAGGLAHLELDDIYPNHKADPRGTLVGSLGTNEQGDWVAGTPTINADRILNYFALKPWRKTVLVLDRATGQEQETAPVLWAGNDGSGSRYPPIIGVDGVLYQQNNYMSDPAIAGGHISGWQPGVSHISMVASNWGAVDEPHAASGGGNLVYWNLCCDRQFGVFDITIPKDSQPKREQIYVNYDLPERVPGYSHYYNPHKDYSRPHATFGGPSRKRNGVYGFHHDTNPPIPYSGKVYMHRGNTVMAFAASNASPKALPMARTFTPPPADVTLAGASFWKNELAQQVQKMLDAGHLRPGYVSHGLFDFRGSVECGDNLVDYWSNSSETIYTLLLALPHLPQEMQQDVRDYVKDEYKNYPPYDYNHVGWREGAQRGNFDLPPEVQAHIYSYGPETENFTFNVSGGWENAGIWKRNPYALYALWKYAETFGSAKNILNNSDKLLNELQDVPSDEVLLNMPAVHNAFIAGHIGYLELQKVAGQTETSALRNELNRLLQLRASKFSTESGYNDTPSYCRNLNMSANFIYMVPELADYLQQNALDKVQTALIEYEELAPYWFVNLVTEGYGENPKALLFKSHGLFMAKALILNESANDLQKYIDVPAFERGDLYHIQKLVALLDSPSFDISAVPSLQSIKSGESASYTIEIQRLDGFDSSVTLTAESPSSNLEVEMPNASVPSTQNQTTVTLKDLNDSSFSSSLIYYVPITATSGDKFQSTVLTLRLNYSQTYLPLVINR